MTERTREIGIRRAVGARGQDILCQFLIEAIVMCGIDAGLGVLIGGGACWLAAIQADWPVVITSVAVALASGFAVAVWLIFGLYPAVRAAHLSPLTVLRHE